MRLHLEGPPPLPDRAAEPIQGAVRTIVKSFHLETDVTLETVRSSWTEIVGPDLARHARPLRFENRVLTLAVKGAVWMSELRRAAPRLLQKVSERAGAGVVSRIAFEPVAALPEDGK